MRSLLRASAFLLVNACGPQPAAVLSTQPVAPARAPAAVSPEIRDPPAEGTCDGFWGALRAGETSKIALETRCRLAAEIGPAAVQILDFSRTQWWQHDAEVTRVAVLIGPPDDTKLRLIADDESCERSPVVRLFQRPWPRDFVEVLGRVEDPTRPDVALRLQPAAPGDDVCAARFSWSMDQTLGALVPPAARRPSSRVPVYRPTIAYLSLPGPTLVVEVSMSAGGEFTVTRAALEL